MNRYGIAFSGHPFSGSGCIFRFLLYPGYPTILRLRQTDNQFYLTTLKASLISHVAAPP